MKKNVKKIKNKKGFTIIEMLIAVLIFSISVSSLMAISSKALKTSRNAEEQLIADYLALEAIEVVHNFRDTAILKNLSETTWELVFQGGGDIFADEGCFNGSSSCNFYSEGNQLVLDVCTDCGVYFSNQSFVYYQIHEGDGGEPPYIGIRTKYDRKIKIKEGTAKGQVIVYVTVSWDDGEVRYIENLYLWQ